MTGENLTTLIKAEGVGSPPLVPEYEVYLYYSGEYDVTNCKYTGAMSGAGASLSPKYKTDAGK